jgi:hypothetical protein
MVTVFLQSGLLVVYLAGSGPPSGLEPGAGDRKLVEDTIRRQKHDGKLPLFQEKARLLEPLGDKAIPILATYLTDYELGWSASQTMLAIDRDRAAPLIFVSMPKSDRNVQYHTFKLFIRLQRNGKEITCRTEMAAAARRCLEAKTNADAGEQALLALGLTGGDADFPLLRKYAGTEHPVPYWTVRLRNAAEAALARMGHADTIGKMMKELEAEVTGSVTPAQARACAESIRKAAFAGHASFVPALCRHLDDPFPEKITDNIPPSTAREAAIALAQIVDEATLEEAERTTVDRWKKWCGKRSALRITPRPSSFTAGNLPHRAVFEVSNNGKLAVEFRLERLEWMSGSGPERVAVRELQTERMLMSDADMKRPSVLRKWKPGGWIRLDAGSDRWLTVHFDAGPVKPRLRSYRFRGVFVSRQNERIVVETGVSFVIRDPVRR